MLVKLIWNRINCVLIYVKHPFVVDIRHKNFQGLNELLIKIYMCIMILQNVSVVEFFFFSTEIAFILPEFFLLLPMNKNDRIIFF